MDNSKVLNATLKFKQRLKAEIEQTNLHSEDMKFWLWKTLIMSEIAQRSFALQVNVELFEKEYFDRYAAVSRHFRDWGMDWVADNYYEISNYIAKFYWPDSNKEGFDKKFIPFELFNIID